MEATTVTEPSPTVGPVAAAVGTLIVGLIGLFAADAVDSWDAAVVVTDSFQSILMCSMPSVQWQPVTALPTVGSRVRGKALSDSSLTRPRELILVG